MGNSIADRAAACYTDEPIFGTYRAADDYDVIGCKPARAERAAYIRGASEQKEIDIQAMEYALAEQLMMTKGIDRGQCAAILWHVRKAIEDGLENYVKRHSKDVREEINKVLLGAGIKLTEECLIEETK